MVILMARVCCSNTEQIQLFKTVVYGQHYIFPVMATTLTFYDS